MMLGNSRGKENEVQLLQLQLQLQLQQQQQQQQKQLVYFQSGLLALVIFTTSYLGFMQNQISVTQRDQTVAIDKLTVIQQIQSTQLNAIDSKLNSIFGGAAVVVGLFNFHKIFARRSFK